MKYLLCHKFHSKKKTIPHLWHQWQCYNTQTVKISKSDSHNLRTWHFFICSFHITEFVCIQISCLCSTDSVLVVRCNYDSPMIFTAVNSSVVQKLWRYNCLIRTVNIDLLKSLQQFVVMYSLANIQDHAQFELHQPNVNCMEKAWQPEWYFQNRMKHDHLVHCILCLVHIEAPIHSSINKLQMAWMRQNTSLSVHARVE